VLEVVAAKTEGREVFQLEVPEADTGATSSLADALRASLAAAKAGPSVAKAGGDGKGTAAKAGDGAAKTGAAKTGPAKASAAKAGADAKTTRAKGAAAKPAAGSAKTRGKTGSGRTAAADEDAKTAGQGRPRRAS
jgi:hypothetical protein